MQKYSVHLTAESEQDLQRFFHYLRHQLDNAQAAEAFLDDFEETVEALSAFADSVQTSTNELLRSRSIKRINFRRHKYFLLFTINSNQVIVVAIGHELQDTNNVIH